MIAHLRKAEIKRLTVSMARNLLPCLQQEGHQRIAYRLAWVESLEPKHGVVADTIY